MSQTVAGIDLSLDILDATVYLSVHNGAPGADGSTNEAAVTRQAITFAAPVTDGTGRSRSNSSEHTFTDPGAATYEAWSIWDSLTGGVCRWIIPFDTNRTLIAGDDLRAAVGAVKCQINPSA